jgi:hypothetical protein
LILLIFFLIACSDLIVTEPESDLNQQDFEAAWKRIRDVYPYLEFKQINWDAVYNKYRPRVEQAQGDEFYLILHDMLYELKDGHAYYHTDGGGEVYPYVPVRHLRDRHAYSPFVVRKYFNQELRVTGSGALEYGILPQNIGYIFLSDFHEDYLMREFPGALKYVQNTIGLIIDIRQKRGGDLANVHAVVSRFISEPMRSVDIYWLGRLSDRFDVQPAGPFTYTKTVVVLINGSTFSAGEICAEMLKQLPQVTVIGDTTGGGSVASSGSVPELMGDYRLPSGKLVYIGTGDVRRYDGIPFENLGIAPDIRVPQTPEDIAVGRDLQLEYAINLLDKTDR